MRVWLNEIQGTADAIVTMYFSKRSWTREKEEHIRNVCYRCLDRYGFYDKDKLEYEVLKDDIHEFQTEMSKLTKWGHKHTTMLRFMDFSITVEGLHRGGQDDWDAHACRYNNRIIRASTRLATFEADEMSEWYQDKIIPMDLALRDLLTDLNIPEVVTRDGVRYVRATNGYVREDLKDDKDAKRGLYMECIPSNFIFKVNLTEWAHVYKQRNKDSHANPEVKKLCETIADQLYIANNYLTRELFIKIEN